MPTWPIETLHRRHFRFRFLYGGLDDKLLLCQGMLSLSHLRINLCFCSQYQYPISYNSPYILDYILFLDTTQLLNADLYWPYHTNPPHNFPHGPSNHHTFHASRANIEQDSNGHPRLPCARLYGPCFASSIRRCRDLRWSIAPLLEYYPNVLWEWCLANV